MELWVREAGCHSGAENKVGRTEVPNSALTTLYSYAQLFQETLKVKSHVGKN